MKRFFRAFPILVLAVCLCCLSPVFAVEGDSGSADIADSAPDPGFAIVDSVPESPEPEDSSVEDTFVEQSPADQPEEDEEESVNDTEAFDTDAPIPIQIVQADTPDDSEEAAASSVYVQIKDWPGGYIDSDSSSDSDVSYILEPADFPDSYISWSYSDGYFTVTLQQPFFDDWMPGLSQDEIIAGLSLITDLSFTVNGEACEGVSLDPQSLSFSFPCVGDGAYQISSETASLYFRVQVSAVSGGSSGLGSIVESLLGTYSPKTYLVTTYMPDGSYVESHEIVPGLAGLDYEWIAGAVLFTLALYCIFRMIGGIFKWS